MVQKHHLGTLGLILLALPATAADPARGLDVARASYKGNCSICHVIPGIGVPEEGQGKIRPSLAGVGGRLSAVELTARITDPRKLDPTTTMPAYDTTERLRNVAVRYAGKPILTPDEIAYLQTLQ